MVGIWQVVETTMFLMSGRITWVMTFHLCSDWHIIRQLWRYYQFLYISPYPHPTGGEERTIATDKVFFSTPKYWLFLSSQKHAYIILTPLNPIFIQWNWGLQGYIYIFFFLLSVQKHRLWVLVRTAWSKADLPSTHNLCFEQKYENRVFIWKFWR